MRVGIDFDNTIVNYEEVFAAAARARGWVASNFVGSKKQLRDRVRLLDDGEIKWQVLQGEVYGPRMAEAKPFPGVKEFLKAAQGAGANLCIVSHKTQYSAYDPLKTDLRQAALRWLESNSFFASEFGLSREQVFFADTREAKIERLSALGCTVFIDDLEEVFAHPRFPAGIKRVLFACAPDTPDSQAAICASWTDIERVVLNGTRTRDDRLASIAARLAGVTVRAIKPARAGGNNRAYRVESNNAVYALKSYFLLAGDTRDRLSAEFDGLRFLRRHGVSQVPLPINADREANVALYEWVEGGLARATESNVDAALDLVRALERVKREADARALPLASEACLSAATIVAQVEQRFATLQANVAGHADLAQFLKGNVAPALAAAAADARRSYQRMGVSFEADLAPEHRCLNPSDFGFHNAIVRPDGMVVFIDFEYFGWDDPVKMIADFLLHPGTNLAEVLKRRFASGAIEIFRNNPAIEGRLRACLPLYALRWTMIMLNEFLPERWQRRVLAGQGGDRSSVLESQLGKARAMLARACLVEEGLA